MRKNLKNIENNYAKTSLIRKLTQQLIYKGLKLQAENSIKSISGTAKVALLKAIRGVYRLGLKITKNPLVFIFLLRQSGLIRNELLHSDYSKNKSIGLKVRYLQYVYNKWHNLKDYVRKSEIMRGALKGFLGFEFFYEQELIVYQVLNNLEGLDTWTNVEDFRRYQITTAVIISIIGVLSDNDEGFNEKISLLLRENKLYKMDLFKQNLMTLSFYNNDYSPQWQIKLPSFVTSKKLLEKTNTMEKIINATIYSLMPPFNFIRTVQAGRPFQIPKAITLYHSQYQGVLFLLRGAFKSLKRPNLRTYRLGREILCVLSKSKLSNALSLYLENIVTAIDNRVHRHRIPKTYAVNLRQMNIKQLARYNKRRRKLYFNIHLNKRHVANIKKLIYKAKPLHPAYQAYLKKRKIARGYCTVAPIDILNLENCIYNLTVIYKEICKFYGTTLYYNCPLDIYITTIRNCLLKFMYRFYCRLNLDYGWPYFDSLQDNLTWGYVQVAEIKFNSLVGASYKMYTYLNDEEKYDFLKKFTEIINGYRKFVAILPSRHLF